MDEVHVDTSCVYAFDVKGIILYSYKLLFVTGFKGKVDIMWSELQWISCGVDLCLSATWQN